MNRKLHNSLMALSTTGFLLVAALLASQPVVAPSAAPAAIAAARPLPPLLGTEDDRALVRALAADARERARDRAARDIGVAAAVDPADAIARSALLIAEAATDAALAAALAEADARVDAATARLDAAATGGGATAAAGHRGRRHAIAVPYFSFARSAHGLGD